MKCNSTFIYSYHIFV